MNIFITIINEKVHGLKTKNCKKLLQNNPNLRVIKQQQCFLNILIRKIGKCVHLICFADNFRILLPTVVQQYLRNQPSSQDICVYTFYVCGVIVATCLKFYWNLLLCHPWLINYIKTIDDWHHIKAFLHIFCCPQQQSQYTTTARTASASALTWPALSPFRGTTTRNPKRSMAERAWTEERPCLHAPAGFTTPPTGSQQVSSLFPPLYTVAATELLAGCVWRVDEIQPWHLSHPCPLRWPRGDGAKCSEEHWKLGTATAFHLALLLTLF